MRAQEGTRVRFALRGLVHGFGRLSGGGEGGPRGDRATKVDNWEDRIGAKIIHFPRLMKWGCEAAFRGFRLFKKTPPRSLLVLVFFKGGGGNSQGRVRRRVGGCGFGVMGEWGGGSTAPPAKSRAGAPQRGDGACPTHASPLMAAGGLQWSPAPAEDFRGMPRETICLDFGGPEFSRNSPNPPAGAGKG